MEPESITITRPDTGPLEAGFPALLKRSESVTVRDEDDHGEALLFLGRIKSAIKAVKDLFAEAKRRANEAHKAVTAAERRLLDPLEAAAAKVSLAAANFEREQREAAEAERRQLEAVARKREEDRRLMEAIAAQEAGEKAQAEAILAQPILAPVVEVAPRIAKVEGMAARTTWSAEVVDFATLVLWVAERLSGGDTGALSYLMPNQPNLNRDAVSRRENLGIPGVRAVPKTSYAATGR